MGPPRGSTRAKQKYRDEEKNRRERRKERERGNEQTLELPWQRNICRWRSPFQSQHGGMIGASTGSYAYPRICGSFFSSPVLFFSRPTYSLSLLLTPVICFSRKKTPVTLAEHFSTSSFRLFLFVSRLLSSSRAERGNVPANTDPGSRPVVIVVSGTNLWVHRTQVLRKHPAVGEPSSDPE